MRAVSVALVVLVSLFILPVTAFCWIWGGALVVNSGRSFFGMRYSRTPIIVKLALVYLQFVVGGFLIFVASIAA